LKIRREKGRLKKGQVKHSFFEKKRKRGGGKRGGKGGKDLLTGCLHSSYHWKKLKGGEGEKRKGKETECSFPTSNVGG